MCLNKREMSLRYLLSAALLSSLCLGVSAQERNKEVHSFKGNVTLGIEQDSTLSIDELDVSNSTDSNAQRYKLNGRYQYRPDDTNKMSFSYTFTSKNYEDQDEFDSDTHLWNLSVSTEVEDVTIGVRSQWVDSSLNNNDFLDIKQFSPYVSLFAGKEWFFSGSVRVSDKELVNNPDRNSRGFMASLDAYYFISGLNHYLQFNVRSRDEDAESDEFDYETSEFKVTYTKRFRIYELLNKVKLSWRWQERDYDKQINEVIGDFRRDNRNQWQVSWEVEFSEDWMLEASARRNNNNSNLISADYDQNTYALSLRYDF